ncbi:unnamed protein product [Phaeothamnion confervicola]
MAHKNLYDILDVPKDADETAIKKAYRKERAALKWHPDKNPDNKTRFQEISEAFEILSDPEKRRNYDRFGPAGVGLAGDEPDMSGGMPGAADGGGFGGFGGFPGAVPGGPPQRFHSMDPNILFERMFGTRNPNEADRMGDADLPFMFMGGGGPGGPGGMFMGGGGGPSMRFATAGGGGGGGGTSQPQRKAPPVEYPLNVTLEDLYSGATKKVRITKRTSDGGSTSVEKSIAIKPGWKDGTKITYEREGDEQVR